MGNYSKYLYFPNKTFSDLYSTCEAMAMDGMSNVSVTTRITKIVIKTNLNNSQGMKNIYLD